MDAEVEGVRVGFGRVFPKHLPRRVGLTPSFTPTLQVRFRGHAGLLRMFSLGLTGNAA